MKIPLLRKNRNSSSVPQILDRISEIRTTSEIIAICPQPTENSWLGVFVATQSLFPATFVELPHYYSNLLLSANECQTITDKIVELDFKQVIYSGFSLDYIPICKSLKGRLSQKIIYHGFLSELSGNLYQQEVFKTIIDLGKSQIIDCVGFIKKGLALTVSKKYGITSYEIILPNNQIRIAEKISGNETNIGCFVSGIPRKNLHTQVVAASLLENSKIHILKNDDLNYLMEEQVVIYDQLPHSKFFDLVGSVDVNLHVTFSESWGQICAESISQGVPCLSANTSSFFDYNEELKINLIVDKFDDSWHIYQQLEKVLSNREYLSNLCIEYARLLNKLSSQRLQTFLSL